jgi:uncharacterized membrane protein
MAISLILLVAGLAFDIVAAITRDVRWLALGLAALTVAQLAYGK